MEKKPLHIITLDQAASNQVIPLYNNVFSGHPWYETMACKHCGEQYGEPKKTFELLQQQRCLNEDCATPITDMAMQSYYLGTYFDARKGKEVSKLAENIYLDALTQEAFTGILASNEKEPVGFAWGYKLPANPTPSVWFDKVQDELAMRGINGGGLFYIAEAGILPELQRQGYGKILMRETFKRAKEKEFEGIIYRTINDQIINMIKHMFGEENHKDAFRDPDPNRPPEHRWYLADFKNYKE